jgi:KR domain
MLRSRGTTVVVVGLGDLGSRVVSTLARSRSVERLITVGRNVEHGAACAGQARLIAALQDGPRHVGYEAADVSDVAATASLLRRLDPEAVVMVASRHTWWRRAVRGVPYGAWLPLQLTLVRDLVRARDEAGVAAPIVNLVFPDGVGPALKPLGLAPEYGAGNVTETAAKLALLCGGGADVRLVMHHAAQRTAFPVFAGLGGADEPGDEPPWAAQVRLDGDVLDEARVRELFRSPWPLPEGRDTHDLTAGAAAHIVEAILAGSSSRVHAPAPGGLPGGYPIRMRAAGFELDLPVGLPEKDAIEINRRAARWDGLEAVDDDGTIVFTEAVARQTQRTLGIRIQRVGPAECDDVAAALEQARDSWSATTSS